MFNIDFTSLDSLSDSPAPASPKRNKLSAAVHNRTADRRIDPHVRKPVARKPKPAPVRVDRFSYRPDNVSEVDVRKVLGRFLYRERAELFHLLITYGACRVVVRTGSINMLRNWLRCYRRREAFRAVKSYQQ